MGSYNANCINQYCLQSCCNFEGFCPYESIIIATSECFFYYNTYAWWIWLAVILGVGLLIWVIGGILHCVAKRRRARNREILLNISSPSVNNAQVDENYRPENDYTPNNRNFKDGNIVMGQPVVVPAGGFQSYGNAQPENDQL